MQGQEGDVFQRSCKIVTKNSDKQKGKDSKAAFFQNTNEKQEGEQANAGFLRTGECKVESRRLRANDSCASRKQRALGYMRSLLYKRSQLSDRGTNVPESGKNPKTG